MTAHYSYLVAGAPRPAPGLLHCARFVTPTRPLRAYSIALALRRSLHSLRFVTTTRPAPGPSISLLLARSVPLVLQLGDRLFEHPAALRVVLEHVETRARRRE